MEEAANDQSKALEQERDKRLDAIRTLKNSKADLLKANFVDSYRQLTQAFGSRFVINSRAPRPLSALLSLSMCDGETPKAYSGRYWEMYNEIDGNFDDVAINTFKNSLPAEQGLRKSLTGKPVTSVRQLMER